MIQDLQIEAFTTWSYDLSPTDQCATRMNRRKADFKFAYKFLEDDL